MIQEDGYIIYSLPEDPNVAHNKEVCDIQHIGLDLHIFVNDVESFPSSFYYVGKTDKWLVPIKTQEGGHDYEWKEFEGNVMAFKYSIYLA